MRRSKTSVRMRKNAQVSVRVYVSMREESRGRRKDKGVIEGAETKFDEGEHEGESGGESECESGSGNWTSSK